MAGRFFLDVTKRVRQGHASGLNRVSSCLQRALKTQLGEHLVPVMWNPWLRRFRRAAGGPLPTPQREDVFLTPETFALRERWGSRRWLHQFPGRKAIIAHDAIPYRYPESTWPRSVRRFPHWLADLGAYDVAFAVSREAAEDLSHAGEALKTKVPTFEVLTLGADYHAGNPLDRDPADPPVLLNIGILEPRKGQALFLEAAESLWEEGLTFELVLLGRPNPHFAKPILRAIERLQQAGRPLIHEASANDERLAYWHARARAVVLPSRAEGFGLPVLEALWAGCPVISSAQPSCRAAPESDWLTLLEPLQTDTLQQALRVLLNQERPSAPCPRVPLWKETVTAIRQRLDFT